MDPWDARLFWKDFLRLLPFLAAFVLGGLFALAIARGAVKKAKKKWDNDFLSRHTEEARTEIEERDAVIADLKSQLREAQEIIRQLAEARKAAITMSSRLSETLATALPIRMSRHG